MRIIGEMEFLPKTKNVNLDCPDGLNYHWHYVRTEPEIFSKGQTGVDSVMIWGPSCYMGTLSMG